MTHFVPFVRTARIGTCPDHQPEPVKMSSCDTAIIGGGIIGLCTTYFLKTMAPAMNVAVIEREPGYEHCSTLRASGGCRVQFSCPENIEMSLFLIDFIRRFPQLMATPGREAPIDWVEGGYLFIVPSEHVGMLEANHAEQRRLGCEADLLDQHLPHGPGRAQAARLVAVEFHGGHGCRHLRHRRAGLGPPRGHLGPPVYADPPAHRHRPRPALPTPEPQGVAGRRANRHRNLRRAQSSWRTAPTPRISQIPSSVGSLDQAHIRPTLIPFIPAGRLAVSEKVHDWGQIAATGTISAVVTVANIGNGPVHIDQLLTNCSCLRGQHVGPGLAGGQPRHAGSALRPRPGRQNRPRSSTHCRSSLRRGMRRSRP